MEKKKKASLGFYKLPSTHLVGVWHVMHKWLETYQIHTIM